MEVCQLCGSVPTWKLLILWTTFISPNQQFPIIPRKFRQWGGNSAVYSHIWLESSASMWAGLWLCRVLCNNTARSFPLQASVLKYLSSSFLLPNTHRSSTSTFSSSEDEAESLALSLLEDGRLLLDHVVAAGEKTSRVCLEKTRTVSNSHHCHGDEPKYQLCSDNLKFLLHFRLLF